MRLQFGGVLVSIFTAMMIATGCGGSSGSDQEQVTEVVDKAMTLYSARDGVTDECNGEEEYGECFGRFRFSDSAPICQLVATQEGCVIGQDTEAGDCKITGVTIGGSDGEFGFAEDAGTNANLYAAKTASVEIECAGIGSTGLDLGYVDGEWLIEDLSDIDS